MRATVGPPTPITTIPKAASAVEKEAGAEISMAAAATREIAAVAKLIRCPESMRCSARTTWLLSNSCRWRTWLSVSSSMRVPQPGNSRSYSNRTEAGSHGLRNVAIDISAVSLIPLSCSTPAFISGGSWSKISEGNLLRMSGRLRFACVSEALGNLNCLLDGFLIGFLFSFFIRVTAIGPRR